MEVVCGPRVFVVVHRRRKDHCKDLKLSQPVLEAKEQTEEKEEGGIRQEVRILGDVCGSVKSIEGKRQEGKTEGKVGRESNEHRRKEWTEIRKEK